MESAYTEGRLRLASAGLDPLCMEDFLNLRLVDDSEYDLWLLADLTGVRHYSHIPVVLAADPMSSDEEAVPRPPPLPPNPDVMFVTSLYRYTTGPKIRALFPG